MPRPIVVLQSFPDPRPTTNPYLVMLRDSLAARPGVEVLTFSWRKALRARYDIAHLHWPEILVRGRTPARTLARQLLLLAVLLRWRTRRTVVVRTRHNLATHEAAGRRARWLLALVDRATSAEVVLNDATPVTAGRLRAVVPHGDYRPWYGGMPQAGAVPGRIAFVGLVRAYKGVDRLLDAFAAVPRPELTLSVTGRPDDAALAADLTARAATDPRVDLRFRYVSDEELVHSVTSAEVVVLPYREMHNSGGALAALSLHRPVLVPDNEVNRGLAEEVGAGWVMTYRDDLAAEDLLRALDTARDRPEGSLPDLSRRSWDRAGEEYEAFYRRAVAQASR